MSTIHALLQGRPGVGKTTIIKQVCELLRRQGFACYGLYTEEVRQNRARIGFDVVSVPGGERAVLARVDVRSPNSPIHVGNYRVDLRSFEEASLAALSAARLAESQGVITVIDEIGKMELKSARFGEEVRRIFDSPKSVVLATVPVNMGAAHNLPLVKELIHRPDVRIFSVNETNRDALPNELAAFLKAALSSK